VQYLEKVFKRCSRGICCNTAGCSWKHGHPSHNLPAAPGQNLYATSGQSVNLTAAIQHSWYASEKVHYDYDSQGCSGVCGHYTQIVWATSRQVGCAVHRCRPLTGLYDSGTYLVCNYYPPGNVRGQRPYTKGPACSRCGGGAGWCKNGLCNGRCSAAGEDCSCAATCYNCASLNAAACRCSCAKGWLGADCSVTCDDKHRYCGVSPGWPGPYLCDRDYVRANCPAMCGLCTPDKDAQPGQCPPVSGPGAHSSAWNRFTTAPQTSPSSCCDHGHRMTTAQTSPSSCGDHSHHRTTAIFALVVAVLAISRGRRAA